MGVGIALDIPVKWSWQSGSVSQIAASWAIAPAIAAGFGAVIMMSIKVLVHQRRDPMKAALRVITFYYGLTAGILALFVTISGGHGIPTPEQMGAGKACGIILGVFAGVWLLSSIFLLPYYYRKSAPPHPSAYEEQRLTSPRLFKGDRRLRIWHIPMGALLWRDNYTLYYPGDPESEIAPNYYDSEYKVKDAETENELTRTDVEEKDPDSETSGKKPEIKPSISAGKQVDEARQGDLKAIDALPWAHPRRIFATLRFVVFHGITRDVIGHQSKGLEDVHRRAPQFDNKVEHLWTTAQVCSAMIMSIAHGANDVSNAIGPFTTEYLTWKTGIANRSTGTPTWIKAVGGIGLGVGFWTFGYVILHTIATTKLSI